jgi:hypothetical protein
MFRSSAPKIEDTMFTLKFSMKQMERMAKKCEKEENAHKAKLKKVTVGSGSDVGQQRCPCWCVSCYPVRA